MQQSSLCEDDSSTADKKNSPPLMEPECSLTCSQDPTTGTILSQFNPFHILTPYFLQVYFNMSRYLRLGLSSGFFLS
jgi:hypothetical protein